MSAEVTEPYSVSFSPTRRAIAMSACASRSANASACDFSSSSRASASFLSRSIWRLLFSVTASASLRGSR